MAREINDSDKAIADAAGETAQANEPIMSVSSQRSQLAEVLGRFLFHTWQRQARAAGGPHHHRANVGRKR